jgi:hypothetical protein
MSDKPLAERLQAKGERRLAVVGAAVEAGQVVVIAETFWTRMRE